MNLGLIKLPDIVKLYTCQLFYDHLINKKSSNLNLSLVSEQHNYATRNISSQHLNPESFRINIRKFCPTILGCYYWNDIFPYLYAIGRLKNCLKKHFASFILLSIDNSNITSLFTMHYFSSLVYFYPKTNVVNYRAYN